MPREDGAGAAVKGPSSDISFGFGMTGGDGVDTDLARRQFEGQPLGQGFDGPLRGRVKQRFRHWMRTDNRAEINDAPALDAEPLDRLLHHENRPEHVDVVVDVKTLFSDV